MTQSLEDVTNPAQQEKDQASLTDAEILAAEEAAEAAASGQAAEAAPAETEEDAAARKNRLPEIPVAEVATITCQEDLAQVLINHARWVDDTLDPRIEVARGRANLSGADLRGYDLAGANLMGANLAGANLEGVNLMRANLMAANLQNTILACTNLREARLSRAKLDGADLRGADLTGAVLTGVDLSKARLKTDDAPLDASAATIPEMNADVPEEHSAADTMTDGTADAVAHADALPLPASAEVTADL